MNMEKYFVVVKKHFVVVKSKEDEKYALFCKILQQKRGNEKTEKGNTFYIISFGKKVMAVLSLTRV